MGIFSRLFGGDDSKTNTNTKESQVSIQFGHYSDNNKSVQKTAYWYKADDLFKEKKYFESLKAFFEYVSDDVQPNVVYKVVSDTELQFELFQGSKKLQGICNKDGVAVEVKLVQVDKPGVPLMRRLLELNYSLYYSRCAMKDGVMYLMMNSDLETSNPNKLYYGLKEIAIKADRYDDLLSQDFNGALMVDSDHVQAISDHEFAIKYKYLELWINKTLTEIEQLNQDTFSGGISYLLLALIQRIDCLIIPEGKLLKELDKISAIYWNNKEELSPVEVNKKMAEALKQLLAGDKTVIRNNLYKALSTFSFVQPVGFDKLQETLNTSLRNMQWYQENKYPDIANRVLEYALTYCQYSYSIQKPLSQFVELFMQINYPDFYAEMGLQKVFREGEQLKSSEIKAAIHSILDEAKPKYPLLLLDMQKLNFSSLLDFNKSFVEQCYHLNFNSK